MRMNRFFANCLKYSALLLLASTLFLGILLLVPNNYIRQSYFGVSTARQIKRAQSISEPKIVFIGGSNCALGLCSPMVSEHFRMPVCNTGVNYIFGLLAQSRLYEDYIHSGDIVIVFPEYQQFYGDLYLGNEELLGLLSSIYPKGYRKLTVKQVLHLLPCVPRAFDAALTMRHKTPPKDSPYVPQALNEFGDVERYEFRSYMDDKDWTPVGWGNGNFQMGAVDALINLNERCKQRNATLLILPPVYKAMNFDANKTSIDKVWDVLIESGLPVVSNPERYRMADSLHYDSEFHLTYEGTVIRTDLVIEDVEMGVFGTNEKN